MNCARLMQRKGGAGKVRLEQPQERCSESLLTLGSVLISVECALNKDGDGVSSRSHGCCAAERERSIGQQPNDNG